MQLQNDIKINEYSVIPQKISESQLKQKRLLLSLALFQDEIEYAIIDLGTHSIYTTGIYCSSQKKIAPHEILFLINDFIHHYHLHQYPFKHIHFICSFPHFTFCPAEFYVPENKYKLLNYVHPVQLNETILNNNFNNIKIIYSIPQDIYNSILKIFPSVKLFHSSTSMMNIFFHHPLLIHSKIWTHIHPNYIEIIAKNHKEFLFYNTFDIQTSLDILYYLLFCIEQLQLNPKETTVHISGNISPEHSIFKLLPRYIYSIQLVHHHPKIHILPIDSSLISHYHFITLNHYLCVLSQENTKAKE